MAEAKEGAAMDTFEVAKTGESGPGGSSDSADSSVRGRSLFALTPEQITPGQHIRLKVYPRYKLRRGKPWTVDGLVTGLLTDRRGEGLEVVRTATGFGRPFVSGYWVPVLYFEEGRVFAA
jgi:hypothetical protein